VLDVGHLPGVDAGIGPGQLKGQPHGVAAKNLVEPVSVFRHAYDDALQLGGVHPPRVLRQDSGLEGERAVVHRLDEEVVNEGLFFLRRWILEERLL